MIKGYNSYDVSKFKVNICIGIEHDQIFLRATYPYLSLINKIELFESVCDLLINGKNTVRVFSSIHDYGDNFIHYITNGQSAKAESLNSIFNVSPVILSILADGAKNEKLLLPA